MYLVHGNTKNKNKKNQQINELASLETHFMHGRFVHEASLIVHMGIDRNLEFVLSDSQKETYLYLD